MTDTVVVMPYDYEDINIDVKGYRAEAKLKKLFTKYYQEKAKTGKEQCVIKQNPRKYSLYEAKIEEYYGEILEEIEKAPTDIVQDILESENPMKEMYKRLKLPIINYATGSKKLVKH